MKHRLALALTAFALPASAQVRNDPAGSSPILGALQWVQGTMLGNLATTAAVIAVAVVAASETIAASPIQLPVV